MAFDMNARVYRLDGGSYLIVPDDARLTRHTVRFDVPQGISVEDFRIKLHEFVVQVEDVIDDYIVATRDLKKPTDS